MLSNCMCTSRPQNVGCYLSSHETCTIEFWGRSPCARFHCVRNARIHSRQVRSSPEGLRLVSLQSGRLECICLAQSRPSLVCQAKPYVFVVMGVSGCGKSTVGQLLAARLSCPFYEGDAFHPQSNIEKMMSGVPLTDEDRRPWLEELATVIDNHVKKKEAAVVSCSALKAGYRDVLAGMSDSGNRRQQVAFVLLAPSDVDLYGQLQSRAASGLHFMPSSLLKSQLDSLSYDDAELWMKFTGAAGYFPRPDEIVDCIMRNIVMEDGDQA